MRRAWFALVIPLTMTAAVPAEENAALKYWLAIAQLALTEDQERIVNDWRTVRLEGPAAELIEKTRGVMTQFRRGAAIEHCDWGLDYSDGPGMLMPHMSKMRQLGRLGALHIRQHGVQGRGAAATALAIDLLRAARHTNQDYTMISLLVRFANEADVFNAMAPLLPKLDAAARDRLAAALDAPRGGSTVGDCIESEKKFFAGWMIDQMRAAEARKPGSYMEVLQSLLDTDLSKAAFKGLGNADAAIRTAEAFAAAYDEMARLYRLPPAEFDVAFPAFVKKSSAENPLTKLLLPAIDKVVHAERVNQTRRALFRTALNIIEGGTDQAKKSTDPFGKGPFAFRALDGGFELTSQLQDRGKPVTLTVRPENE